MNAFKNHKVIVSMAVFVVFFLGICGYCFYNFSFLPETEEVLAYVEEQPKEIQEQKYFVDIKGAVKKPGVYEVSEGSIVNDVIKLAGGLKTTATTKNINLSQKVRDEMVIYVFSKSEIKVASEVKNDVTCTTQVIEVNNCVTKEEIAQETSEKININTASKEELMKIPGVGASKADSIIIYRMEHKFTTIEDIMQVSGIGESVFAKIKDSITV